MRTLWKVLRGKKVLSINVGRSGRFGLVIRAVIELFDFLCSQSSTTAKMLYYRGKGNRDESWNRSFSCILTLLIQKSHILTSGLKYRNARAGRGCG
jgi:hypothetical protein